MAAVHGREIVFALSLIRTLRRFVETSGALKRDSSKPDGYVIGPKGDGTLKTKHIVRGTVEEQLRELGVNGVLVRMAKNGQLLKLRCEMPTCYCPQGRKHFDPWPNPRTTSERKWSPNVDHYPTLKKDHGRVQPSNVRLAHVFCNNMDYGWRTRIRSMLEKHPDMSFKDIADALNRKKSVVPPPGASSWTAKLVRKAYVS